MTESVANGVLKVHMILFAVFEDVLVNPFVHCFRVDLERPNQPGEHFDAPWIPEDSLDVRNIHTKLISKTTFDFKWHFTENPVHGRYSFV